MDETSPLAPHTTSWSTHPQLTKNSSRRSSVRSIFSGLPATGASAVCQSTTRVPRCVRSMVRLVGGVLRHAWVIVSRSCMPPGSGGAGQGRTGVGHGEDARAGVAELEVLVLELEAVDALAASAVACTPAPGSNPEMLVVVWGQQLQRGVQIRDWFAAPPRRATHAAVTLAQTQIQAASATHCAHVERCERHRWGASTLVTREPRHFTARSCNT